MTTTDHQRSILTQLRPNKLSNEEGEINLTQAPNTPHGVLYNAVVNVIRQEYQGHIIRKPLQESNHATATLYEQAATIHLHCDPRYSQKSFYYVWTLLHELAHLIHYKFSPKTKVYSENHLCEICVESAVLLTLIEFGVPHTYNSKRYIEDWMGCGKVKRIEGKLLDETLLLANILIDRIYKYINGNRESFIVQSALQGHGG